MEKHFTRKVQEMVLAEVTLGRFLTEKDLADRLGVSRTPVREVLGVLEEQGVLERRKNAGIRLRRPTLKEIVEIYDLRTALEGMAARLLAVRADRRTIARLDVLCRKEAVIRRTKPADSPESDKAELAFHQGLVDACGNEHLKKVADTFRVISASFRFQQGFSRKMEGRFTHERILAALKSGDPDRAEEITRRHIQEGKENLLLQAVGPTAIGMKTAADAKSNSNGGRKHG